MKALLAPITAKEVAARLSQSLNTALGPDSISWRDLSQYNKRVTRRQSAAEADRAWQHHLQAICCHPG
ncbi:hypothetical protein J437_LFUL004177 [Ladona fulva]|uniref:Uncharacterized protein n=1 Tax=Ladona fulva TaxID=123851 RepID=A0A8K0JZV2_LADFU|nr:hypothetical protein J437_LFUL004177 [Ladona fulva]